MSKLSLVRRQVQARVFNAGKKVSLSPKSVTSLAVILFFVVGAFYIGLVNYVANKGAALREMSTENEELKNQNDILGVEAARLGALRVINESATGKVEVGDESINGQETDEQKPQTPANPQINDASVQLQTVIAVKPKLVPSLRQSYLPTYAATAAIAKR